MPGSEKKTSKKLWPWVGLYVSYSMIWVLGVSLRIIWMSNYNNGVGPADSKIAFDNSRKLPINFSFPTKFPQFNKNYILPPFINIALVSVLFIRANK